MRIKEGSNGYFKYQSRIEFEGIDKNPIYGDAYISSYFDIEKGKPKIQPGQCRIVIKNLSDSIKDIIENDTTDSNVINLIRKRPNDDNHYYFYWMRDNVWEIEDFETRYKDAYNLKYAGFLQALKS